MDYVNQSVGKYNYEENILLIICVSFGPYVEPEHTIFHI